MIRKVFCGGIRSVNDDKFTAEVVMSDETLDRYDEVIRVTAYQNTLKQFKKHPVLLSSHKYSDNLRAQIGEWEDVWIEGKKLIGRAKWYVGEGNPEADWGFKLAQKGIAAFSVGFRSLKATIADWDKYESAKKEGKRIPRVIYDEVDLVETSQVLVPANPSALQRSLEEDTVESKYFKENLEIIKTLSNSDDTLNVPNKYMIKGVDEEYVECIKTAEDAPNTLIVSQTMITEEAFNKFVQEVMLKFSEMSEKFDNITTLITASNKSFVEFSDVVKTKLEDISTESIVKTNVPDTSYIDKLLKDDDVDSEKDIGIDLTELKASIEGLTTTIKNMKVENK